MKIFSGTVLLCAGILLFAGSSGAGDVSHKKTMDHSAHLGELIRTAKIDGYSLAYHLIDAQAQMSQAEGSHTMTMEGAAQMKSHHLMLFLVGPDGEKIESAKVGYLLTSPDGEKQKVMTMTMKGGVGGDVDLKADVDYVIKTKIVHNDKSFVDEFTFNRSTTSKTPMD